MNQLFDRLMNEADRIGNDVFPALAKQAEDARQRGDILALQELIRKQRGYTNRMAEIVRMLEKVI